MTLVKRSQGQWDRVLALLESGRSLAITEGAVGVSRALGGLYVEWSSGSPTQRALMLSVTILTCLILGICVNSVQFDGTARRSCPLSQGQVCSCLPPDLSGFCLPFQSHSVAGVVGEGPMSRHCLLLRGTRDVGLGTQAMLS